MDRAARRLQDTVERHPMPVVAAVSVLYLGWTALLASRKLMWNDELYTYYIATQPTVAEVWRALMTGAEQIPPGFHLLTRGVLELAGAGPISIRLPEILGFLLMMLCLFFFVARRTTPFFGLVAMLFPLVTDVFDYAYEARPYGLLLGMAGLCLVAWQAAAESPSRRWALPLLTLSLAAALASHYYAVLVWLALAIGEIARTTIRGRLDRPVWIALVIAAGVPLLAWSPLILAAAGYSNAFHSRPSVGQLPDFYRWMLAPATVPVATSLLVGMVVAMYRTTPEREWRPRIPPPELLVAVAFAVVPLMAFAMALLVTKAFVFRYALPAVLGLSLLGAFGLSLLPRGRAAIGTTFLLVGAAWFALGQYREFRATMDESRSVTAAAALLDAEAGRDLPIVASEPHIFMLLAHYGPPGIQRRLVYLGDPAASLQHLGHNSVDRGMVDLVGPWFRLPVKDYDRFVAAHPEFWVYGNLGWLSWLTDELRDDGARIEMKDRRDEEYLLLVTLGPASGARGPASHRTVP